MRPGEKAGGYGQSDSSPRASIWEEWLNKAIIIRVELSILTKKALFPSQGP
jgi:hypothetical protein